MDKIKMPVEEFTTPSPITAKPLDTLTSIKAMMDESGVRHIPIVSESKTVGMISQRDLKVALMVDVNSNLAAEDIMVRELLTATVSTPIEDVVFEMSQKKVGSSIIQTDGGEFYGIFTSTDALNALIEIVRGTDQ